MLLATLVCVAQDNNRFDPKRFEAELEQYIVTNAGLSPDEASRFFPLYREMRRKQRALFSEDKFFHHVNSDSDKDCAEAIRKHDANDIEMKEIIQEYHNKFMKVLPASKVYKIIVAEDKFHRQSFKRAAKRDKK